MCAYGYHHRVETLLTQPGDREIAACLGIQLQRDVSDVQNLADLRIHHATRQAIFRNTQPEHAASGRRRFEDSHRIAQQGKIVGSGQPDRTASDNCHTIRQLFDRLA